MSQFEPKSFLGFLEKEKAKAENQKSGNLSKISG